MKKIMLMAMMAAAATTTFAQDALVKEAKKLFSKGEFDAATQTLAPALTSSETLDKAAAWNLQSEIYYGKWKSINDEEEKRRVMPSEVPYDTVGMHNSAIAAWESILKCDEFDQLPDAKGKVKLKYRSAAQNKYKTFGVALVQAGQYKYQQHDNAEALKAWKMFLNMKESSIMQGLSDYPVWPFANDILYYVAYLSYQEKAYDDAVQYARQLIAADPEKAEEANEIMLFAQKDNCKTHEDTLAFVNNVKQLHRDQPDVERYFNLLMDYYSRQNDFDAMLQWANEEIEINADNKTVWFLKGYALMQQEKYDDAAEAFKKSIELDPTYVEGFYNTGACLNSKARMLQDELADKRTGTITNENFEKVKDILRESKGYLEKAQELDPNCEKCNWVYPLWQVYYALGDTAKADEMERRLNNK